MYKYNLNIRNVEVVHLEEGPRGPFSLIVLTIDVTRRHACWAEQGEIRFINYLCLNNRTEAYVVFVERKKRRVKYVHDVFTKTIRVTK